MKNLFHIQPICFFLITALFTGINVAWSEGSILKGDVTGDGFIDGRDALLILQHAETIVTLRSEQMDRGDVYPNPGTEGRRVGDGQLTRDDAQTILEETVGLIPLGDLTGDYSQSQPVIDAIEPFGGRVGDSVTLMGRNFPAGNRTDTELYLGEVRVEIVSVTGSLITFLVPKGAVSGRIRLNSLGGAAVSRMTFSVLDTIAGVLKVDAALDPRNFLVFSIHDFAEIDNAQGMFTLYGPKDEMLIYQAATVNDDNPNLYQYYWIPGYSPQDGPIQIDALSTAKAMVFTNPFIASKDEILAAQLFDLMDRIPQVTTLAQVIAQRFPLSVDGVNDPEIRAAWEASIEALLLQMGSTPSAKTNAMPAKQRSRSTAVYASPAAAPLAVYPADADGAYPEVRIYGIDNNYLSAEYNNENHSITMGLDNGYSPVDWMATLYKLDPDDYPRGLNTPFFDIQKAGFNQSLYQTSCLVPANLWTAKINVRLMVVNEVMNLFQFGTMVDSMAGSTNTNLQLRGIEDGLYLIHGYSGSLYTSEEGQKKDFEAIWNIEDGFEKMSAAFISNLTQIVVDIWDFHAKTTTLNKAHIKVLMKNVSKTLASDLTDKEFLQRATDEVIANIIWDCLVEAIKARVTSFPVTVVSSIHGQLSGAAKEALEEVQDKAEQGLLRSITSSNTLLKFLGQVSAGGRVAERFLGLLGHLINVYEFELSPGPSPLESAIVVVGDPFSPQITSISPIQGPPGSEVMVEGKRFWPDREGNEVWFGITQAEVIAVQGREKLIIRVPEANINFAFYKSYGIRVETPGMMKPGQSEQQFTLLRIPVITSIEPYRIVPSVPANDPGPFAGHQSTFEIRGAGFMSPKGIMDKVFIGDREITELSFTTNGDQIIVTVPEDLIPGKYEVYIVSPENNNFTTPRFPIELIGPPEVSSLDPTNARAGDYVIITGVFLTDAYAVKVGNVQSPEIKILSGAELKFRMPTVGNVGDILPVRVYSPSGASVQLSITRQFGLSDTITSFPKGYSISVGSTKSGDEIDGKLSLDEAAAIARGEMNPYEKPRDDESIEWTHHFYEIIKEDSDGIPIYEWEEKTDKLENNIVPGGPGDETIKHYRVEHSASGNVSAPILLSTENLDDGDENKEEGDFVSGNAGGADYADTIKSIIEGDFHAANLILGDRDSLTLSGNSTLSLGGRGIQINSGCTLNLPTVTCQLGDAVTIAGLKNTVKGHFLNCGQNAITIQEGIGNTIQDATIENCDGYGIAIHGGGANSLEGKITTTTKGGVIIENSDNNN
ncbi:MAG: IPT/TIG domain-containing protein, partial [bacterium]